MGVSCLIAEKRVLELPFEIRLQTNQAFATNLALYAKLAYAIDRTEPFRGGMLVHLRKRIRPPCARTGAAKAPHAPA